MTRYADAPARVLVVGAGPAGLATAHALLRQGIRPRVVDGAPRVAQPWRDRHDRLRLNTHRRFSVLPGLRFPRSAGVFPHRDDVVAYLEEYERRLDLPVEWGVPVRRVERADAGWCASTPRGDLDADHVVLATGPDRVPVRPHWPGEERFGGVVVHAAEVRRPADLAGHRVLVVGFGNSGVDLAGALVRADVARLWVSARSGVTVVPRRLAGLPLHPVSVLTRWAPVRFQDASTTAVSRLAFGNLTRFGVPRPPAGAATRFHSTGVSPAADDGLVAALARGDAAVVPEVEAFEPDGVRLVDGRRLDPDVVVCATGYRTGLEPLVGHLGVLDGRGRPLAVGGAALPQAPGLWFAGHRPPFHGNLHGRGPEARALARALARAIGGAVPPSRSRVPVAPAPTRGGGA